jgi:hypothetical protein
MRSLVNATANHTALSIREHARTWKHRLVVLPYGARCLPERPNVFPLASNTAPGTSIFDAAGARGNATESVASSGSQAVANALHTGFCALPTFTLPKIMPAGPNNRPSLIREPLHRRGLVRASGRKVGTRL